MLKLLKSSDSALFVQSTIAIAGFIFFLTVVGLMLPSKSSMSNMSNSLSHSVISTVQPSR